jgi:hypothetical protein
VGVGFGVGLCVVGDGLGAGARDVAAVVGGVVAGPVVAGGVVAVAGAVVAFAGALVVVAGAVAVVGDGRGFATIAPAELPW